jgi:hypothetical protein
MSYYDGRRQEALTMLINLIERDDLSTETLNELNSLRRLWTKTLDSSYQAPQYPAYEDIRPIMQRSLDAIKSGNFREGLQYAWYYFQYCAAGTIEFHAALSHLTDCAALLGDIEFARYAADMYLSHYDLIFKAAEHTFTPVGLYEPVNEHFWPDGPKMTQFSYPLEAAVICISKDSSTCWARILELAARYMPSSLIFERYDQILAALKYYYKRTGDTVSLKQLEQNHPRSVELYCPQMKS